MRSPLGRAGLLCLVGRSRLLTTKPVRLHTGFPRDAAAACHWLPPAGFHWLPLARFHSLPPAGLHWLPFVRLHWLLLAGFHWLPPVGLHSLPLVGLRWLLSAGFHWLTVARFHWLLPAGYHWLPPVGLHWCCLAPSIHSRCPRHASHPPFPVSGRFLTSEIFQICYWRAPPDFPLRVLFCVLCHGRVGVYLESGLLYPFSAVHFFLFHLQS